MLIYDLKRTTSENSVTVFSLIENEKSNFVALLHIRTFKYKEIQISKKEVSCVGRYNLKLKKYNHEKFYDTREK